MVYLLFKVRSDQYFMSKNLVCDERGRGGGHTNLYLVNVGICEFSFCPT